jgi:outer membrane protein TolC
MVKKNYEVALLPYNSISILQKKQMNVKSRKSILIILFLATILSYFSSSLQAQSITKELKLDEAIHSAVKNNKNISLSKLDEKIALAKYKQTDAIFLPQVSLGYTAAVTDNPLNAFGVKLQRKDITQSDFNPKLLNHPSGTWDFMTGVNVNTIIRILT